MELINIVSIRGHNVIAISLEGLYRDKTRCIVCVFFREIQESELQKFYSRLARLLQGKELGHETVDSLQRLHLILSATKYTRT